MTAVRSYQEAAIAWDNSLSCVFFIYKEGAIYRIYLLYKSDIGLFIIIWNLFIELINNICISWKYKL